MSNTAKELVDGLVASLGDHGLEVIEEPKNKKSGPVINPYHPEFRPRNTYWITLEGIIVAKVIINDKGMDVFDVGNTDRFDVKNENMKHFDLLDPDVNFDELIESLKKRVGIWGGMLKLGDKTDFYKYSKYVNAFIEDAERRQKEGVKTSSVESIADKMQDIIDSDNQGSGDYEGSYFNDAKKQDKQKSKKLREKLKGK